MTDADVTPTPEAPRYVVTGGGTPTAEQLAALAVALTPVAVVRAGADDGVSADPAWIQAALQEGIGRRPFVSADDLAAAPPLFT